MLDHDVPIPERGKGAPYGIYGVNRNEGFVTLGTAPDTAECAVESMVRWRKTLGVNTYP
ncbi:MAG: ISAzo13 family transposase, partial [Treponema sp.]|nr:ISAzo13 family transposase [Treponema sp.]